MSCTFPSIKLSLYFNSISFNISSKYSLRLSIFFWISFIVSILFCLISFLFIKELNFSSISKIVDLMGKILYNNIKKLSLSLKS